MFVRNTNFWWADFDGRLIFGGNFALQNGFGLTIKTAHSTKIIA